MKRPPQTLHFGQLWTLFIDGNLNEHQDAELADWLARGGRIERGTIEDLDCHQLLRSAGHVARTENDFVCDLIEHLSPPTPSSKSEAQEADGHRSLDMPAAFAFRKSSVDQTPGNARPYRRLFAMLATAGSFLAVAALLYGLSSRTPAPTAQADTPPPRFDGTTAKRDLQDLETDPLTEPIEPLITVSTLAVPATTTNEPEAATDTDETIIAEASGETLGIEAQELEIIEEEAIEEVSAEAIGIEAAEETLVVEKPAREKMVDVTPADGAATEKGLQQRADDAIGLALGAIADETADESTEDTAAVSVPKPAKQTASEEEATAESPEKAIGELTEKPSEAAPPVTLKLLAEKGAKWETEPTDIQHELLTLHDGEATIGGDFGQLTITGPATVFLDLPTRVTLQDGEVSIEVSAKTPVMIDTAFGSAVARGRAQVVCSVDGMSVRALDAVTLSSPADSWEVSEEGHKMLTATGQAFDWYAALDLTKDKARLVIDGATVRLPRDNVSSRCSRQIASALLEAERAARKQQRLDFTGVLRVNSMVKVYKKTHDLTVARNDAEQFVNAARRARSGRAVEGPGRPNAKLAIDGAAANPGRGEAAVDVPVALGAMGAAMNRVVNNAIDANSRLGNRNMAEMMKRAVQPMQDAMSATPPASVPNNVPRFQRMNELQLQQQLMMLPEVEVYRNQKEALRMTTTLTKISRVDARSVPPRREPVFEILPTRPDLQGLPYLRGEQCRLPQQQQAAMASLSRVGGSMGGPFLALAVGRHAGPSHMPGLIQILQAKSPSERVALNHILMNIGTFESLESLAKRAMYDTNPVARHVAVTGLRGQQAKVRSLLLDGLRYPWAPVAAHAAEALARLKDKEAVPALVALLDEPHPSAPQLINGKWMTREVVRLNHMKNCMLCHAPSTSPDDLMRARVPVPGNSQVSGPDVIAQYYGSKLVPGPFVRADITYLRQDFSITTHTDEMKPWPQQQRSDFLVRARPMTAQEMLILNRTPLGRDYPQRRAVLFALQELTGLDMGDDSAAWRAKVLAKN